MELSQFLLVFTVVGVLALVAAKELLDLLSVLGLQLLQSSPLLLLELGLSLAERTQLLFKGPSHLLHLPRHGNHTLRVLPGKRQERWSERTGELIYGFLTQWAQFLKSYKPAGDVLARGILTFWLPTCLLLICTETSKHTAQKPAR